MKLFFHIDYRTNWGESVFITGDIPALGGGDYAKAAKLDFDPRTADKWSISIDIPEGTTSFSYRYFVRHDNGGVKNEWGKPRKFLTDEGTHLYHIYDRWQDMPWDKPYYASAFTNCICRHDHRMEEIRPLAGTVMLEVSAPMVAPGHTLAVSGEGDVLGNWQAEKVVRMNNAGFPVWKVRIDSRGLRDATQYKFLIIDDATGDVVAWEGGANRTIGVECNSECAVVLAGMRFINDSALWKGAGVAIPVFSIRTKSDFGVGDFYSIKDMVDWAAATGQTFIQLLPVNDTTMTHTWTDSYPYNANSIFALHPMYIRLEELGTIKDPGRREYFRNLAAELNSLKEIDYERVNDAKTAYCREIFAQEGASVIASDSYKAFVEKNKSWLMPYAAYCTLRDRFGSAEFGSWGEYKVYDEKKIARFIEKNRDDIDFVCYLQYNLDKQMRHVHEYANCRGIAIKGDIPIGISRTSVDAWTDPRLFNLDCQAGAPPDDFSVLGQNWGLPTYNWEEMNRDGFAWWKARFRKMSEYFDAYRIDHILGFFRIWQIPEDQIHGLLGVFNPALPFSVDELRYNYDFWIDIDRHTTPFIMDYFVEDFFGPYTSEACKKFMTGLGHGRYRLKDEFNTQRKISDYFANESKNEKNQRLCDGLMGLVDNVLFIEDPYEKGKYHPRISAQFTYVYRSLNDYERWCFDRLYNDFYYHRHNDFWYGKAMWKLPPLIDATDMLVCAEDLGMIPACVPSVMHQLEILSLEIQRMPKDPGQEFGNTWSYPYYSVCTTSTHDMGGIRQWWEEDREKTQHFYNNVLHCQGAAPYYAEPWVCDRIVDLHLESPSMLCILPLQDWLSIDGKLRRENPLEEQINVPANSRHYWRYRMHICVEDLLRHSEFTAYLRDKIKASGR